MFRVNESTAEVFLYDDIGPDWLGMVSDGMVVEALDSLSDRRVTLRINSSGGDVFMATAISNAMRRHSGGVDVAIDGVAASAAAFISMAAETVTIAANAQIMIHNPWTIAAGNAADFRKLADDLDIIGSSMLGDYVAKTGQDRETVADWLAKETWFDADRAVETGFANGIGLAVVDDISIESKIKSVSASVAKNEYARRQTEDVNEATPARTAAKIRAKRLRV